MVHTLDHPPLSCDISPNFLPWLTATPYSNSSKSPRSRFQPTDTLLHASHRKIGIWTKLLKQQLVQELPPSSATLHIKPIIQAYLRKQLYQHQDESRLLKQYRDSLQIDSILKLLLLKVDRS
jgi:hypothetical protein